MRFLLTTASALALFAAPAFAATTPATPGAGASGATTSSSTNSQSTTHPSAAPSTKAMTAPTGTSQAGTSQPGATPAGTSQNASKAAANNKSGSTGQADQTFVKKASSGNIAEVQLGKLAEHKSHDPAVQEFGRWMQTDHTMAQGLLEQSAKAANIEVPTKPDSDAMKSMKKLQAASGTEFDSQYINGAVKDHQKDIKLFQTEAQNGQDTQLKGYAQAMLPALQAHLEEAQALQSNMSSHTAASGAAGSSATGNSAIGAGNGTAKPNQQQPNKGQRQ